MFLGPVGWIKIQVRAKDCSGDFSQILDSRQTWILQIACFHIFLLDTQRFPFFFLLMQLGTVSSFLTVAGERHLRTQAKSDLFGGFTPFWTQQKGTTDQTRSKRATVNVPLVTSALANTSMSPGKHKSWPALGAVQKNHYNLKTNPTLGKLLKGWFFYACRKDALWARFIFYSFIMLLWRV